MDEVNGSSRAGCRSTHRARENGNATPTLRTCHSTAFNDANQKPSGGILALEPHYAPNELAGLWGMSGKVIRSIFLNEVGVLKIDRPEQRNKRSYCSLRIPQSTAIRVHRRLSPAARVTPAPIFPNASIIFNSSAACLSGTQGA